MSPSPSQIKDKLINALDGDRNVVDEKAVEEVLTFLEATTLTKEILEQTRLGRDINNLRKTSKNPIIAKRARNLVKSWKKLLDVPNSPHVNGHVIPSKASPGLSNMAPRCITSRKTLPSPCLSNLKQGGSTTKSPAAVHGNRILTTNGPERKKVGRPPSISNDDSNLSFPNSSPLNESSQDRLLGTQEKPLEQKAQNSPDSRKIHKSFNIDSAQNHSTELPKSAKRKSDKGEVSKTNVANRKRTRSSTRLSNDSSEFSEIPHSKQPRFSSSSLSPNADAQTKGYVIKNSYSKNDVNSLDSDSQQNMLRSKPNMNNQSGMSVASKFSRQESSDSKLSLHSSESRSKLNRVKTTEELIEEMQRKSATRVGNNVIAQIRTNQIQKESDNPIATPVKGKRGRKKKNKLALPDSEGTSDCQQLAQTKNEYIERFLQTSVAPTPGEDQYESTINNCNESHDHSMNLTNCEASFPSTVYESSLNGYHIRQDKPDSGPSASPPDAREINVEPSVQVPSKLPERLTEKQIQSNLPPIDYNNIDWSIADYPAPEPIAVTESLVSRLHNEDMESLNGTYDRDGQFRGWAEMLTMDSIYDEPLFILPYVMPSD